MNLELTRRAEIEKLARDLRVSASSLDYLSVVSPSAIRALRERAAV